VLVAAFGFECGIGVIGISIEASEVYCYLQESRGLGIDVMMSRRVGDCHMLSL
jgi:hypothetical protein